MTNKTVPGDSSSDHSVEVDTYDRGIVPAETAARREREGDRFKTHPTEEQEAGAESDDQTHRDSIRTTDGYTVDKEGLLNNYAVEPEMYINEPGDLREKEAALTAERATKLAELKHDSEGDLTMEGDKRHQGQGLI